MAYIQTEIRSPALSRSVGVQLYFPTDLPPHVGNEVKGVITLLHGLGNSGADWAMMSAATRYAADNGYVLVMPDADNSFYTDLHCGAPYFTLLTEELPRQLNSIFHIPLQREKNFIAGLSMGGYGALLMALRHPGRWAAAGSFSGAVDMRLMLNAAGQGVPGFRSILQPLYGSALNLTPEGDLFALAQQVAKLPDGSRPRILLTCGEQDNDEISILTQNNNLHAAMRSCGLPHTYLTWQGVHEWSFWDRSLAEFIGFVQNSDYARRKQADWSAPAKEHD